MSVINEMLKDLDKRKADEQAIANGHYQSRSPATATTNNFSAILVAVLITASICIAAMYFLYPNVQSATSSAVIVENILTAEPLKVTQHAITPKVVASVTDNIETLNNNENHTSEIAGNEYVNVKPSETEQIEPVNNIVIVKDNPSVVMASPITTLSLPGEEVSTKQVNETVAKKSSLVISKVDLTPEQLAHKKFKIAKRALQNGQLKKAEALLEEAIILHPYYIEARKELAALWFGRKTYKPAKNLLAQGVILQPKNESFRLMLARIYSIEGNNEKAFKILKELSTSKLLEYQLALASMASQSDHHVAAINAYNKLLVMRPEQSRWWLALAISYDSNEQYQPATSAYQKAIALDQLSNNSLQFAKQRLAELEG